MLDSVGRRRLYLEVSDTLFSLDWSTSRLSYANAFRPQRVYIKIQSYN